MVLLWKCFCAELWSSVSLIHSRLNAASFTLYMTTESFGLFYASDLEIATLNTHSLWTGKLSFQSTYGVTGLLNIIFYPYFTNTWNDGAETFEFVNWILAYVLCMCFFFSPVLADLLDKVVAHLSSSSTECFFSPAQYKGQWEGGTLLVFFLTI